MHKYNFDNLIALDQKKSCPPPNIKRSWRKHNPDSFSLIMHALHHWLQELWSIFLICIQAVHS